MGFLDKNKLSTEMDFLKNPDGPYLPEFGYRFVKTFKDISVKRLL